MSRSRKPQGAVGPKLAEGVARQIEQMVMDQGWQVGANLGSEPELLARFGVSRAALREAVRIVEHHGVAQMRRGPQGGLIVATPDAEAVERAAALYLDFANVSADDLFTTRTILELASVRMLAEQIDEDKMTRLREYVASETDGWDGASAGSLHRLHVYIAELTGNAAMSLFVQTLAGLTFDRADTTRLERQMFDDAHAAHVRIVDAIVSGDAALAQERMRKHLLATVQVPVRAASATRR